MKKRGRTASRSGARFEGNVYPELDLHPIVVDARLMNADGTPLVAAILKLLGPRDYGPRVPVPAYAE